MFQFPVELISTQIGASYRRYYIINNVCTVVVLILQIQYFLSEYQYIDINSTPQYWYYHMIYKNGIYAKYYKTTFTLSNEAIINLTVFIITD